MSKSSAPLARTDRVSAPAPVALHERMTIRGVEAAGTKTVTSTMYGRLRQNAASCEEFLALAGLRR